MGPCDDLPAKPELRHWGTMRRARRDLVTRLCRASVNSAIKEHGVMCRLTATAFDENDPFVRTLTPVPNGILYGPLTKINPFADLEKFDFVSYKPETFTVRGYFGMDPRNLNLRSDYEMTPT
ncbi:hypothetical protein AVEN_202902-1 [Araneus ventricosus]|uniref:Uncharacterized protein n=1 Tax=Araneus ventricosus TaxID=182803 RepID=A0A4Y2RB16_ARAVE|nr:hypothetical protein AVEN_202902-1 [Araneus ventricosus]